MSDALLEFEWTVASDYRWITTPPGSDANPVLVEVENASRRSYRPMHRDHAALFKRFAATEISKEAVLAFAREFGLLGGPVSLAAKNPASGALERGGERLWVPTSGRQESWERQITSMRDAIELLDASRSGDMNRIAAWLEPLARTVAEVSPLPVEYDTPRHRLMRGLSGWVQHELNATVSPTLLHEPSLDRVRLVFAPTSLIGAMWLQLAFAITENKAYPSCKFCERPFEIAKGATGFRKNREFCSDACKSADYRSRRADAARLLRRGVKARVIAQRTNTDVATVREWAATLKSTSKGRSITKAKKTRS
jgi:hypothetical protein